MEKVLEDGGRMQNRNNLIFLLLFYFFFFFWSGHPISYGTRYNHLDGVVHGTGL